MLRRYCYANIVRIVVQDFRSDTTSNVVKSPIGEDHLSSSSPGYTKKFVMGP